MSALIAVGFGLIAFVAVIVALAAWQIATEAEQERDELRRENQRLRKAIADLVMDRAEWQAKAQQYAQMLNDVAEDAAMDREYADWKQGIDPALAAMTPEQVERLLAGIFAPVRPSPASYATLEDLLK